MIRFLLFLLCLPVLAFGQGSLSNGTAPLFIGASTASRLTVGGGSGTAGTLTIVSVGTPSAAMTIDAAGGVQLDSTGPVPGWNFADIVNANAGIYVGGGGTMASGQTFTNLGTISGGSVFPSYIGVGTASQFSLPTSAGSSGQVLALGTSGATTGWVTVAGGTPGGTSGQIQYNNAGAFGGLATTGSGVVVLGTSGTVNSLTLSGTTTNSGTISNGTASGMTLASGTTTLVGVLSGGTVSATALYSGAGSVSSVPLRAGTAGVYDVTGAFGHAVYNTSVSAGLCMGYGGVRLRSDAVYSFSPNTNNGLTAHDATISRNAAGVLQIGTTTNNALGSLLLTNLTATGTIAITGTLGTGTPSAGFIIGVGTSGALQARGTAGTVTTLANP